MVIPILLRCITQRSVLAVLATTTSVGLTSELSAQYAVPSAPIHGPAPEFDFLDVPLAEGERIISSSTSDGGVVQYGGNNYRMIDSSSVPTAATGSGNSVQVQMPSVAGGFPLTGHCATGNCGSGSCSTCGPRLGLRGHGHHHGGYPGPGGGLALHGGGGTNLGGHPRLGAGGNVCGPTCNPYHYAAVDVLYMTNDNLQNYVGVAPFTVSDYDYEFGVRATLGTVPDCHHGYEATFVGPFRWRSDATAGAVGTNLTSVVVVAPFDPLNPPNPLPLEWDVNLNSFANATAQFQRFEAEMNSFELNRTLIGWEVIKLLYGVRYIQYDEEFLYSTVSPDGPGALQSEVENRMIGGQLGIEMTYPVTCRLWTDFRGRAGAYANFAENVFLLENAGVLEVGNTDDTTELAGVFELGGGLRYYLTNNLHIRAGAELWYIAGVASATDQFTSVIRSSTGSRTDVDDDVFLFGVNAGLEWKF